MIDKITPKKLDSSTDFKLIPKNAMIDALNVIVSEYESTSEDNKGSAGVLKNVKSNRSVSRATDLDSFSSTANNYKVIGSIADEKNKVIYFFVYCDDYKNNCIIAYDKYGVLPSFNQAADGTINFTGDKTGYKVIYIDSSLNFQQDGFVSATIAYTSNSIFFDGSLPEVAIEIPEKRIEIERDPIIYFTDNYNQPRKINVHRALLRKSGQLALEDYSVYDYEDFINACPKTPLYPITFRFDQDTSKTISNFKNTKGFQFAYQFVYKDNIYSSISSYSSLAVPQVIINQGTSENVNYLAANRCLINIPFQYYDTEDGSYKKPKEVKSIKILAREGDDGKFLEIDEVEANVDSENWSSNDWQYSFYNDRVSKGVSNEEFQKQFDNVPHLAEAVTTVDNRLFYGNYVEGLDPVKTSCQAQVLFYQGQDEAEEFDVAIKPAIGSSAKSSIPGQITQYQYEANTGFSVDFSSLPDSALEGSIIDLTLNFTPDSNYHIFSKGLQGYQQSSILGENLSENFYNDQTAWEDYTSEWIGGEWAGEEFLQGNYNGTGKVPYFGKGFVSSGSFTNSDVLWIDVFGSSSGCLYGTSAANPIILQGKTISFSISLQVTADINTGFATEASSAIKNVLVNGEADNANFSVLSFENQSTINIDLGLSDYSRIDLGSPLAKMITGVRVDYAGTGSDILEPRGYFIINKGNATFSLHETEIGVATDTKFALHIETDSITDVEALTCVRRVYNNIGVSSTEPTINTTGPWYTLTPSLASNPQEIDSNLDQFSTSGNPIWEITGYGDFIGEGEKTHLLGRLSFTEETFFDATTPTSLLDGEGGPGSFTGSNVSEGFNLGNALDQYPSGRDSILIEAVFENGDIVLPDLDFSPSSNNKYTVMPFIIASDGAMFTTTSYARHIFYDLTKTASPVELLYSTFSLEPPLENNLNRTYKSNSYHEFGVVYYDQRGRHGFVNPLTTVFVPGYANQDRPVNGKGRVNIELTLNHAPPSWAHNYKIVQTGSTSVSSFIQYTAGGAFVPQSEEGSYGKNIYVSLNYLQSNQVSYSSSFGARSPEKDLALYSFTEGDRVRVISYYNQSLDRVYPFNIDFEVIDLVTLGEAENPLSDNPSENQKGQFLVLKNNPQASFFSYESVSSNTDKWGDNTVIEVYTPSKFSDKEDKFFYETSRTYNVIYITDDSGNQVLVHQEPIIILTEGDVWWRKVAVNFRQNISSGVAFNEQYADVSSTGFIDLIIETPDSLVNNPSESRFVNLYLETSTFSDLMDGNSIGVGRPNLINNNAKQIRRDHSLTYSARSNPAGGRVFYSDFNQFLINFKDLTESYGAVNYLASYGDSIFCLQENKCSVIPVSRNILSDATGSNQIVSSRQVLGDAKYYAGRNGCDGNPESVQMVDGTFYFASKSTGKVFHFSPSGGVADISNIGMSTTLKNEFVRAIQASVGKTKVRVVGGYDPRNEEYLVTILPGEGLLERINSNVTAIQYTANQLDAVIPEPAVVEEGEDLGGGGGTVTVEIPRTALEAIEEDGLSAGELQQINQVAYSQAPFVPFNTRTLLADVNNDGVIGTTDLLSLLAVYGDYIDSSALNIIVIPPNTIQS